MTRYKVGDKIRLLVDTKTAAAGTEDTLTLVEPPHYDSSMPVFGENTGWLEKGTFTVIRKEEPTALKNDKLDNKIPMELLRTEHIAEMLRVFKWARDTKYPDQLNGDPNYYLGHGKRQLMAAAIRHALAVIDGEDLDPESGYHHVGHLMCCAAMFMKQLQLGTLKEDK